MHRLLAGYAESSRLGPRVRHAFLFAWLTAWAFIFAILPPHDEASSAANALEVSGDEITYYGSPVRLRGVATEDVYDLYLEERNPAVEYGRMATN